MEENQQNWLSEEVDFYDFIWKEGTRLCGAHVNQELLQDFAAGGSLFEEMKAKILAEFPDRESALKAFKNRL